MNEIKADNCLIFLSDVAFSVLAEIPISNELKSELLKGALPQGSKWKIYAGARSVSFFHLKSRAKTYALSYSVVTANIVTPIISFIIILDKYESEKIITHQIQGIENAFARRIDFFASLDKNNSEILKNNLVFYKSLEKPTDIERIKRKTVNKQVIFTSVYKNQQQWQDVEMSVLAKAAYSLTSFRTLALQKEAGFQILGLITSVDENKQLQKSDATAIIIIVILFLLFIVAIIALLILVYIQQPPPPSPK